MAWGQKPQRWCASPCQMGSRPWRQASSGLRGFEVRRPSAPVGHQILPSQIQAGCLDLTLFYKETHRGDHHQWLWGTNSHNIFDTVRPRSSKNSTGVMCSYISAVQAGCRQPRGVRISFTLQRAAHRGSIRRDAIKEAKNITEKSKNQIIIYAKSNETSYFFCPCCATHNKLMVLLAK